jgi:hypothetical protein
VCVRGVSTAGVEPIGGNKRYTLGDLSRGTLKPSGSERAFRSSESCCVQCVESGEWVRHCEAVAGRVGSEGLKNEE